MRLRIFIAKYNITLFAVFSFLIPFGQKTTTVLMFVLLLESFRAGQLKNIKISKNILLPALMYLFLVFSLLYSSRFDIKFLTQKTPLLIFPIIFYFRKKSLNEFQIKRILNTYVLGCVMSILILNIYAFYRAATFYPGGFHAIVQPGHNLFQSMSEGGNLFFGKYFSAIHQTVYYAVFLLFSYVLLLFQPIKNKKINTFFIIIVLIGIFQISNRVSLLITPLIYVYYLISQRGVKKRLVLLISIILLSAVIFVNPRFNKIIGDIYEKEIIINPTSKNSFHTRLLTWNASIQIIKENILLGVGVGDHDLRLMSTYKELNYINPLRAQLNSHNQFLTIAIQIGMIGFILLLVSLGVLFFNRSREYHYVIRSLSIILFVSFLFESMFQRYSGLMFFSFFYSFFAYVDSTTKVKL